MRLRAIRVKDPDDMGHDELHWDQAQDGAELIAEGDPEAAVPILEALAREVPRNPYAFFFLGAAHYELERYDKALKAYLTAIELAPDYLGALIGAGHCLRMVGRHAQALGMGKEVLRRQADDPEALYLLGATHFARGDTRAAAEYLERFLGTNPEPEVAIEAQGMLQVLAGDIVDATPVEDPD
ncbi:MAG: tetratricopeptide repeat protein [Myxococcales bacterium]|nr:tetratricopeptide repeat protein [Myxococcales bacterium]